VRARKRRCPGYLTGSRRLLQNLILATQTISAVRLSTHHIVSRIGRSASSDTSGGPRTRGSNFHTEARFAPPEGDEGGALTTEPIGGQPRLDIPSALVVQWESRSARSCSRIGRSTDALRSLGKPFLVYLSIAGLFDLGNSSDAFLALRAQERGVSVVGILGMLAVFNGVYALVSTPAGSLSDRLGRRRVIIAGWLVYAAIYLGFGLAQTGGGRSGRSTRATACTTASPSARARR